MMRSMVVLPGRMVHAVAVADHVTTSCRRYCSSRTPATKSQVAAEDIDEENRHLIRRKISTHNPLRGPYLARHCRRNMVGSPPRGVLVVVDYR